MPTLILSIKAAVLIGCYIHVLYIVGICYWFLIIANLTPHCHCRYHTNFVTYLFKDKAGR